VRVADAVGAGVAAADDDDVLARRGDRGHVRGVRDPAVAPGEVLHRRVDAVQLAPGDGQVARHARARGEDDRVELRAQVAERDVDADVDAEPQLDALGHELLHAALDDGLLDLEVGDAEAHEPARRLVALEQDDAVALAAQLLRARHAPRVPSRRRRRRSPCRPRARRGWTQPSAHARSMIAFSICLIVTASPSRISRTHAASHGAGHSRPVNSGKLFVACSC
jgi:hypothetical protein